MGALPLLAIAHVGELLDAHSAYVAALVAHSSLIVGPRRTDHPTWLASRRREERAFARLAAELRSRAIPVGAGLRMLRARLELDEGLEAMARAWDGRQRVLFAGVAA